MANVSHASLTGSQLHEPKGVASAALGTVYVSNGTGSGNWSSVGTSSFTGMIADFTWPVVQDGWLELDGSIISTTTYGGLFAVMTIQQTGTRISGNPVITSLSSTSNMKVGYYVFGVGITSGTTILSVDSPNQITLSGNAGSSGSATVIVSPWLVNSGTIKLPDVSTAGRYRRSRTASTAVGQVQSDQNQLHTHAGSTIAGTTDSQGSHTHTATVTDPGHIHNVPTAETVTSILGYQPASNTFHFTGTTAPNTASATTGITVSNASNGAHTHSVTGTATIANAGGSEARPVSLIVMTCVKT